MSNVKFELNLSGLNEIMKSGAMQSLLYAAASGIAGVAGEGYKARPARLINFIAVSSVSPVTWKARRDNSRNNTLEKAAGGFHL